MKVRRKTVLKWLDTIAASLPEETYKAYPKYHTPRVEENENGLPVTRIGALEDHHVSHKRRLRKLFDLGGLEAVEAYLRPRGFSLLPQTT